MAILVDDPVDSFNPRARAGRDPDARLARLRGPVSIHAPARGATEGARPPPLCINVSIHAPARGATFLAGSSASSSSSFNPRARAGRDVLAQLDVAPVTVSIHAPARGATRHEDDSVQDSIVSIHAPARGATQVHNAISVYFKFQSTRPRGARPASEAGLDRILKFQSTRPRGARPVGDRSERHLHPVSIHAPARGATSRQANADHHLQFQSTRPRGARPSSPHRGCP